MDILMMHTVPSRTNKLENNLLQLAGSLASYPELPI